MSIKHDHVLNPVTALEFYYSASESRALILAGEGRYLKIFDVKTSILLHQAKVFEDQVVHGVAVRRNIAQTNGEDVLDIVVWGGLDLAVITHKNLIRLLTPEATWSLTLPIQDYLCHTGSASDWILDGLISHQGECFLVSAHNTVYQANIKDDSLILDTLQSPSRSILYSAQLVYESEVNMLVAAGTVFGETLVWRCSLDQSLPKSQLLHRFQGHEGSVFGVNISEVMFDYMGKAVRLLASCSDDRTIRIWELNLYGRSDGDVPSALAGSETEVGGKTQQEAISDMSLAIVMAHASRIWSVQFLLKELDIMVLSFGEDATTQLWVLENTGFHFLKKDASFNPDTIATLSHQSTLGFHTGKHIWAKAILPLCDMPSLLSTGGADGMISLVDFPILADSSSRSWLLQDILQQLATVQIDKPRTKMVEKLSLESEHYEPSKSLSRDQQAEELSLPMIPRPSDEQIGKIPPKSYKSHKDAFNKYAFVSENQILATTTFGRVLLGEIGSFVKWTEINMPGGYTDLKSYSIVISIPDVGIAFMGSANGTIFLYRSNSIQKFGKIEKKIADMFSLNDGSVELLVTTLGGTHATMFEFMEAAIGSEQFTRSLQLFDKFIVTSAGKIGRRIVLGSRSGALAVYDLANADTAVCSWSPAITGDAVTSIVNLPHSSSSGYFLTTSRNGTYAIFSLADSISMVHQGTPPFGPMVEAAWFSGVDLILYGFRSKNFIVWNETQQYEISRVGCGGAHRSYAYSPVEGSDGAGHFIYTKASRMYLHSKRRLSHKIIKPGGHGREIKACAVSPDGLIATGAEDTTLRIWRYQDDPSPVKKWFDSLVRVQKHTTGIQHLQWHGSSYLFSSGGNEELFIWAVADIPGFGIGVVCEASNPDQSDEHDLRIMSFDVSGLPVPDGDSERLLISLAFSDSTVRCYTYSKTEKFSLVANGRYTSSCFMQLRHFGIGEDFSILTAGTDGYLCIWKARLSSWSKGQERGPDSFHPHQASNSGRQNAHAMNDLEGKSSKHQTSQVSKLATISSHRIHQSSIKALDIATTDNKVIVATGGDDNALGLTVYQANDLSERPRSIILRSAHAAAITGLSFVSQSPEGDHIELGIVTSSNDQRVKEWRVILRFASLNLQEQVTDLVHVNKIGDAFTSVADVGDIAFLKVEGEAKKVLVVGNGMEVFEVGLRQKKWKCCGEACEFGGSGGGTGSWRC